MNYSIELADVKKNIKDIVVLWKWNMPLDKDLNYEEIEDKCNWFYVNNPYGPCKLWLLRRQDNCDVIGSIGISYRKFKVKSQYLLFGLAQNFAVEKKYRTLGPSIMLLRETYSKKNNESMVIYGGPTDSAVPAFKRVGFKEVGKISRYTKLLNVNEYLKKRLRSSILITILSECGNFFLKIRSKDFWFKLPKNYIVTQVKTFDKSFDDLWEKAKENYPVIEERNSVYLNWRFNKCPHQECFIFCLKNKEKDFLVAYLIYKYENDYNAKIIDIMSIADDKYFFFLLFEFVKEMRRKKVISITFKFLGTSKVKNVFRRAGFIVRQKERPLMFHFNDNESSLYSMFQDEENLYFTSGDEND